MADKDTELMLKAEAAIRKARFQIITDKNMTFFGVVMMNMKPIAVTHIMSEDGKGVEAMPTAATDGHHLFYNPNFINSLPAPEVKGVICHEVGHVTGFHHDRMGARKLKRWNIATDMKINSGLRDIKIALPKIAIYADYRHANMTAEEVYNVITDPPPSKGGGEGDDPGGCGSFLSPRDDQGNKLSKAEARRQQNKMRGVVEEASKMAKAQGAMPSFVERLINESQHEPLSWKDILRRFMMNHIRKDYTWRRPNRRMIGQGVYLPSQRTEGVGEIVFAIDTSGSISQPILNGFAKEAQTIINDCEPDRVHVIYCDAAVHRMDTFEKGQALVLNPIGGGGTDFRPVFRHVHSNGINPLCLIFFTDTMGSFGDAPDYPVLWAVVGNGNVPWGEKINLNLTDQ